MISQTERRGLLVEVEHAPKAIRAITSVDSLLPGSTPGTRQERTRRSTFMPFLDYAIAIASCLFLDQPALSSL